ncbi:MAG TPA: BON domain-containing protein [Gemmatimonadaceae bacterium]|nr:BON domain-containing protein [Gemmatimonadaceae bacterium]
MARDFENIHHIDELSDDELRGLVKDALRSHNGLDVDDFRVRVEEGVVVLEGRVGTDGERRIAEHVVTDVLGIVSVRNDIVIDPLRRAESPMAIDDHLAEEDRTEGLLLGDRPRQGNDEAVLADEEEDERALGATDVGDVIANGVPWIPPESPTPEGMEGTRADRTDRTGEDH